LERQSLEPYGTWQRRSSLLRGSEVQSRGTRGCAGAHLYGETRFEAEGHMAVLEPTSVRRLGAEPRDTWQLMAAHLAIVFLSSFYVGVPDL
jgi:hypothetical protein